MQVFFRQFLCNFNVLQGSSTSALTGIQVFSVYQRTLEIISCQCLDIYLFFLMASSIQMYHNLFILCFIGEHLGCVLEYSLSFWEKKKDCPICFVLNKQIYFCFMKQLRGKWQLVGNSAVLYYTTSVSEYRMAIAASFSYMPASRKQEERCMLLLLHVTQKFWHISCWPESHHMAIPTYKDGWEIYLCNWLKCRSSAVKGETKRTWLDT